MSKKHPIIAVTGSSGAGTTSVQMAFEHIFTRKQINAAYVEGDSFHLYGRDDFEDAVRLAEENGNNHFSHFGPDANDFRALEALFASYGQSGTGLRRYYLHDQDEANLHNTRLGIKIKPGQFTPYEEIEAGTDLLFYEGLHGMVKSDSYNVAKHVDLAVGVVPNVNLEWIQKIHRDGEDRGYSKDEVVDSILRRMPDYVHHITPQFSRTDINFQRVAVVDTSNPFIARDIPTLDESFVVIRFKSMRKLDIDLCYLLTMIHDSFMSRRNTLVVPGGKMGMAIEIIFAPIIEKLMKVTQY